jgi:GT2 family glycosyltransferase
MESCVGMTDSLRGVCDVSVIIVTYNSEECIQECLESVLAQVGVSLEIIVVDNKSSDNTASKIEGKNCRVIENKENTGFGRGCNLGFSKSSGKYIYLLNPDACLVGENSLAEMCRIMDKNPKWGLAGAKVLSIDGQHESPPSKKYPGENAVSRDFSKLPGDIAWIIGASMIIRREVYQKLAGFDADYFLYSEETDLCLRARELGFEIGYIDGIAVSHIGGKSEGSSEPCDVAQRKLCGLLLFREKHYPQADCIDLAKRDLRRAFFRMIWNRSVAILRGRKSKEWGKYRNYRGVWMTSTRYLSGKKKKG